MMNTARVKAAVVRGYDRNIVVSDSENTEDPPKLTRRLVALMRTVARHNHIPITHILVGTDAFDDGIDYEESKELTGDIPVIAGVEIEKRKDLNVGGPIQQFYEELGGTHAPGCSAIVVAIGQESNTVLLGGI